MPKPGTLLYHHRTRAEDAQGIHIAALCKGFRQLGWNVILQGRATTTVKKEKKKPTKDGGNRLFGLRIPYWFYELLAIAYAVLIFPVLLWRTKQEKPQFIYERYALFNFAGILTAKWHKIPLILEVNAPLVEEMQQHDGLFFQSLAQKSEQWIAQNADYVIAVSEVLRQRFIKQGVQPQRIVVMPNGVDPEQFHPHIEGTILRQKYQLENHFIVGFVGWIRPWHGVDRLIQAVATLKKEGIAIKALIVGDGPAVTDLKTLAEELNITPNIVFTGAIAREEIPAMIAAMDICVQPDVTDYASPIKLFEYLAMGKAVIAVDRANIREIVRHKKEALLIPAKDTDAFSQALRHLCKNPTTLKTMQKQAEKRIQTLKAYWSENAQRVIMLIEQIQEQKHTATQPHKKN
ncbi:glycosyltransferase family 4 protein [Magnetococcales bacterium HHB-1]